jgi:hypothetical protein
MLRSFNLHHLGEECHRFVIMKRIEFTVHVTKANLGVRSCDSSLPLPDETTVARMLGRGAGRSMTGQAGAPVPTLGLYETF